MAKTIFKRIIDKEIPAGLVYEDDDVLAFNDINPQAPLHVLVIPKQHVSTTNDLSAQDDGLVGDFVPGLTGVGGTVET